MDVAPTVPEKTPGGYVVPSSILGTLEDTAALLRLHPCILLNQVPVIPEYSQDFYSFIKRLINKSFGLTALVRFVNGDLGRSGIFKVLKGVEFHVDVWENVTVNQSANGTRIPALAVAEWSLDALHGKTLPVKQQTINATENRTLYEDDQQPWRFDGIVHYVVRFETSVCLEAPTCTPS